jgi:prepilin signal peptidase PulO-like enzyme (type II secretory pathway)
MSTELELSAELEAQDRPALDAIITGGLPAAMAAALIFAPFLRRDAAANMVIEVSIVAMVAISLIDITSGRVPNILVYPAVAFALAGTGIVDSRLFVQSLEGAGCGLGIMFALAIIGRGAMGMGDVKFAAFTGALLGWKGAIGSLVLGFAAGGMMALVVLLLRVRGRKDSLPLTPFLAAGGITWGLFLGFLLG